METNAETNTGVSTEINTGAGSGVSTETSTRTNSGANSATAKAALDYDGNDMGLACIFPLIGFLFIKLIPAALSAENHLGAGVAVFTLCFLAAALIRFWRGGMRPDRSALCVLAFTALLGLWFLFSQNTSLQFFALLLLIAGASYCVLAIGKVRIENRLSNYLFFDLFSSLVLIPFGNMGKLCRVYGEGLRKKKNGGNAIMLLLGILIAIPVFLGVGGLLHNADAAFEHFWTRFIAGFFSPSFVITLLQILLSFPVSMYLFGLFFGAFHLKGKAPLDREKASALAGDAKILPFYLVIGAITPLLVLYLLFFFSQTTYFLSAFRGLLPEGMIYAEYARRGFFELCKVSFINLIFLGVLLFLAAPASGGGFFRRGNTGKEGADRGVASADSDGNAAKPDNAAKPGKKSAAERIALLYGLLLSCFSVALIAISLSKMFLYIRIYGLTPLRVYTSWFMLFLLFVFAALILRLFRPSFAFVRYCAGAAALMFLLLCYAGTDQLIARYNIENYRAGNLAHLDLSLLDGLGSGTAPYLISVMEDEAMDAAHRDEARLILRGMLHRSEVTDSAHSWRSATLEGYRADLALRGHRDAILAE